MIYPWVNQISAGYFHKGFCITLNIRVLSACPMYGSVTAKNLTKTVFFSFGFKMVNIQFPLFHKIPKEEI